MAQTGSTTWNETNKGARPPSRSRVGDVMGPLFLLTRHALRRCGRCKRQRRPHRPETVSLAWLSCSHDPSSDVLDAVHIVGILTSASRVDGLSGPRPDHRQA